MFAHFQVQFSRHSTTTIPEFRQSRKRFGRSRHHGQQSGPVELGSANADLLQRHRSLTDGIAANNHNQTSRFLLRQPVESRPPQHHLRSRFQAAGIQLISQQNPRGTFTFTGATPRRPARRDPGSPPSAPISPTSCSACPTPARSPSATPTSISANRITTPSSPTIGESAHRSP